MEKKPTQFSPEVRERAVRMVVESRSQYGSQGATIESLATGRDLAQDRGQIGTPDSGITAYD
jgi:hypothetical protein